jgi:hypothetical protein
MTIIIALKTRGIEKRHFMKMENELTEMMNMRIVINPQKMTLKKLAT